jgi:S1-C subfamily serine protease
MISSGSAKVRSRFFMCTEKQGREQIRGGSTMSEPFAQNPYQYGQFGQYPPPEPPRRHRGRTILGLTATAVVAAGVGAGAAIGLSHGNSGASAASTSKNELSTSQIASKVDPGLVDVTSTLGYQDAEAMGTGIVLTANGEILTNNHVINGATSISVTDIGNGKTYKATVVGYDESKDVAVLQLAGASGLATAPLGDSSTVSVGSTAVGLGNAGGAGGTPSVAAGTVTALNQSITASDESSSSSEQLSGLIETNADIQSGDSGGPLVNSSGEVIGMDTAASASYQFSGGGNSGYGGYGYGDNGSSSSGNGSATQGYAIPIDTALSIAKQIEAGQGSSTVHLGATAFLGIELQASSASGTSGVEIAGAQSGTPAASAGLEEGDTITALDGKSVSTGTGIQDVLIGLKPGDKVSVSWTDATGASHTSTITLATGPAA